MSLNIIVHAMKDKQFRLGWVCTFLTGLFPIAVGSLNYFRTMMKLRPDHWITVFTGKPYSNGDLPPMGDSVYVLSHMGFTNLIATGVTLTCLSYFAIRKKIRWGWWLFAFLVVWVGVNDSVLTLWEHFRYLRARGHFPVPLFPLSFGILGLILTWSSISKEGRA